MRSETRSFEHCIIHAKGGFILIILKARLAASNNIIQAERGFILIILKSETRSFEQYIIQAERDFYIDHFKARLVASSKLTMLFRGEFYEKNYYIIIHDFRHVFFNTCKGYFYCIIFTIAD